MYWSISICSPIILIHWMKTPNLYNNFLKKPYTFHFLKQKTKTNLVYMNIFRRCVFLNTVDRTKYQTTQNIQYLSFSILQYSLCAHILRVVNVPWHVRVSRGKLEHEFDTCSSASPFWCSCKLDLGDWAANVGSGSVCFLLCLCCGWTAAAAIC